MAKSDFLSMKLYFFFMLIISNGLGMLLKILQHLLDYAAKH